MQACMETRMRISLLLFRIVGFMPSSSWFMRFLCWILCFSWLIHTIPWLIYVQSMCWFARVMRLFIWFLPEFLKFFVWLWLFHLLKQILYAQSCDSFFNSSNFSDVSSDSFVHVGNYNSDSRWRSTLFHACALGMQHVRQMADNAAAIHAFSMTIVCGSHLSTSSLRSSKFVFELFFVNLLDSIIRYHNSVLVSYI